MTGTVGIRVNGGNSYASLGVAVSAIGDINGDGLDDFLVTAPYERNGVGYVIFGDTTPTTNISTQNLSGAVGFKIEGDSGPVGDIFDLTVLSTGTQATAVGDFNGDGIDDFAISAASIFAFYIEDLGDQQVYIIYGRSTEEGAHRNPMLLSDVTAADATLLTGIEGTINGLSAGDINGDGLADLVVSQTPRPVFLDGVQRPASDAHAGYVLFGNSDGVAATAVDDLDGSNGFAVEAPNSTVPADSLISIGLTELAQTGISAIGDVEGDGFDDLAITVVTTTTNLTNGRVTGAEATRSAHILSGTDADFDAVEALLGDDAVLFDIPTLSGTVQGNALQDVYLAPDLRAIGDVNNDGHADLAVGDRSGTGSVAIHYGSETGFSTTPDSIITREATPNGFFADGVFGVGDVSGDGIDDFVISAQLDDIGAFDNGSVYLIFGTADGFAAEIDLDAITPAANDALGYKIIGEASDITGFGRNASGMGDVNGDGFNDLGIGADFTNIPGLSSYRNFAGKAFTLFGGAENFEAADLLDGSDDNVIDVARILQNPANAPDPIVIDLEDAGFFGLVFDEGSTASFTLTRTGNLSTPVTFSYRIDGIGTTNGADFVGGLLPQGTGQFSSGAATTTLQIPIASDLLIEGLEEFQLTITEASAQDGTPVSLASDTTYARISDVVEETVVSVAALPTGGPGDEGPVTFRFTRDGELGQAVTVAYTLDVNADTADFTDGLPQDGSVRFAAGENEVLLTFDTVDDAQIEFGESVGLTITGVSGAGAASTSIGSGAATAFISDNDLPKALIVFGGEAIEGSGGNGNTLDFTVARFGPLDQTGTFDYRLDLLSANGNDISGPFTGSASFGVGQSEATVSFLITPDFRIEANETTRFTVTGGTDGSGTGYEILTNGVIGTILNDDTPPPPPRGAEADLFGDPHLVTLDGLGYDFQAVGEYVLVETTTANDPGGFSVQVRFEPLPGSDLVSVTTRMAVEIGGKTVELDAVGPDPLLIDGVAVTDISVDLDGDGSPDIFRIGDAYTLVLNDANEQLSVKVLDGSLNVCVFLSDASGGHAGAVRGLMGNANGDRSDDLMLRNGTVLPEPLTFDTLYGTYADDWAVPTAERSFTDTRPSFPDGFPIAKISLDDLPDELVAVSRAAVEAAGLDPNANPIVFESAVLDFALTSSVDFIEGAGGVVAQAVEEAVPTEAPALPETIGVTAAVASIAEGDEGSQGLAYTFYRLGDLEGALDVDWEITGVSSGDLDGGPLSGTVGFADGEDTTTLRVSFNGDQTPEDDAELRVTITGTTKDDTAIAAAFAVTDILDDDAAPVAVDDAFLPASRSPIMANVLAQNPLTPDSDADGDSLSVIEIRDADGNTYQPGTITLPSGARLDIATTGSFTYIPPSDGTSDRFFYTVSDGNGGTDEAEVRILLPEGGPDIFEQPGVTVLSPAGDRFISSDPDSNEVYGLGGNDLILASDGADQLSGAGGSDVLIGSGGNDMLRGGIGSDEMSGGSGADTFIFAAEDFDGFTVDTITDFTPGEDRVALSGFDVTDLASANFVSGTGEGVLLDLGSFRFVRFNGLTEQDLEDGDILSLTPGDDLTDLSETRFSRLTDADDRFVTDDSGVNVVEGQEGQDSIITAAGADVLRGGADADFLLAGAGMDIIIGGNGNDVMSGGTEADRFVFEAGGSGFTVDTITDFALEDRIELRGYDSDAALTFLDLDAGGAASISLLELIVFEGLAVETLEENAATIFEYV